MYRSFAFGRDEADMNCQLPRGMPNSRVGPSIELEVYVWSYITRDLVVNDKRQNQIQKQNHLCLAQLCTDQTLEK